MLAGDVQRGTPLQGSAEPVRFTLTTKAALDDALALKK